MTVNLTKPTDPIASLGPARLTELARGVVTDKWLIADMEDERWQHSLTLLIQLLGGIPTNVAALLVPVAPHLRGWWNGNIPAVTVEVQYVPEEDLDELRSTINQMTTVLWPTP